MADVDVPVSGLEARATVGWECPRCRSVHAPFISSCPHCDAAKFPKAPVWLLSKVKTELEAAGTAPSAVFTTQYVKTLHEAAKAK